MKIQYVGMFDAVAITELGDARGFATTVVRGESVEVDDDLGKRLCEQEGNWKLAPEPRTKASANTEAITPSEG